MIGFEPYVSHTDFKHVMGAISACETVECLVKLGQDVAPGKLGLYHHMPAVGNFDYHHLNRFWAIGIPPEVERYFEEKQSRPDPAMEYVFAQARPFWVTDLLETEEFSGGRNRHRLQLLLQHLGDGLLVPLYGPFHKQGYTYLAFHKPREFFDDIFLWQIQAIMQAVHVRYCMIVESLRTQVKLTNRESEVLELITFGKTNPEIGIILGISTSTVTGHVKRIFLKMNTSDRVTTALRARSYQPVKPSANLTSLM